eukprot:191539_1
MMTSAKIRSIDIMANSQQDRKKCINDKCVQIAQLVKTINNYSSDDESIETINISKALNNYHHIITQHNTLIDFEFICKQLSYCNIKFCTKFKNNNIMNKIHCYFHAIDIGNRLSIEDRDSVHYCDEKEEKYFENIKQINQIIRNKNKCKTTKKLAVRM